MLSLPVHVCACVRVCPRVCASFQGSGTSPQTTDAMPGLWSESLCNTATTWPHGLLQPTALLPRSHAVLKICKLERVGRKELSEPHSGRGARAGRCEVTHLFPQKPQSPDPDPTPDAHVHGQGSPCMYVSARALRSPVTAVKSAVTDLTVAHL